MNASSVGCEMRNVELKTTMGEDNSVPSVPGSRSEPILLFEQVTKWYGPVIGVNHVSLELRGGITGLVGANGAGKSTLLRLATGQLKPNLGRVTVLGVDAWDWQAKRHVGYCPDIDAFYEDMSGRQFVATMARLCGYERSDSDRRTEAVLERVGMKERANRKLRGYSKGMRQRIKLAQALLHDPDLLILDEPLSGIDPIGRQELLDLFRELAAGGKCLLISSHELEELEKLTDHVAVMARGRIAAVGTLTQIRDLLDDQPLTIRIDTDQPRCLAALLVNSPDIVGIEFEPKVLQREANAGSLIVRAKHPQRFFKEVMRLVIEHNVNLYRLEALDDSAHAILGYLLGGSGKT
jgi:ABC-2 type transport system ATP-binding protein